jgi:hypothetical protein
MDDKPEFLGWSITALDIWIFVGVILFALFLGYLIYRGSLRFWIRRFHLPHRLRIAVLMFMAFVFFFSINVPGWPMFDRMRVVQGWIEWLFLGLAILSFLLFLWLYLRATRRLET